MKIGPRKLFSDWDLDWANRPKFVKSYKQAQKEFWAQKTLRRIGSGQNYKMDQLGINVIKEAHLVIYLIYFTSVVKLGKTQDIRPNLILCLNML